MKTMLRKAEAIRLSNVPKKEMPACDVQDIFQVEQTERRNCLGKDLYDEMLEDLVDYSEKDEFVKGTTYNMDDVVLYNGCYYVVVVASTTQEPSKKSDWDLAPKFNDSDFEELWCSFLGRYFSLIVIRDTIQPQTTQLTGGGLIKVNGENFQPVSDSGKSGLFNWCDTQIGRCYRNMHEWLIEKIEDGSTKWSNYKRADEADLSEEEDSAVCCEGDVWDSGQCSCTCGGKGECDGCVKGGKLSTNSWFIA